MMPSPGNRLGAATGLLTLMLVAASSTSGPALAEASLRVNRILYVDASGTTAENCQSLKDVLSSITDNSATNRYVLRLEPGIYDCQSSSVIVGEGIALVGAGVDYTAIRGFADNVTIGVVHINGSAVQLRSMTILNQLPGPPTFNAIALGIRKVFGGDLINDIRLEDLTVGSTDIEIAAYNAQFRAWTSSLGHVVHDGPVSMTAVSTIHYCQLNSLTGPAPRRCHFSYEISSGDALDLNCLLPP